MKKEGITITGHKGTWYVIDEAYRKAKKCYLLEHETYGDEAASIIIDENYNILAEEVYNGFDDLDN